jgi:large repetitive protein
MKNTLVVVALAMLLAACGDNLLTDGAPVAIDQQVSTAEDTRLSIRVDASDPEGAPLRISFTPPMHGTVSRDELTFTYMPEADYHGADTLRVRVSDGLLSADATIAITVTPVNDAPVAVDDALAASEDTPSLVEISALVGNDTDIDGDVLTVTAVDAPTNGTVALAGSTVTFTPAANFVGNATFAYTVSDGAATAAGTVTVTVGGENDPPVATEDTAVTAEDTPVTLMAAALLANDIDLDGQTLSLTRVASASSGTVALDAGVVTYTPTADFSGTATFDYTVSDGAATDTARVTVTVTQVNDGPVAADDAITVAEDAAATIIDVLANDSDLEGAETVTAVTQPANGTVTLVTGVVRYQPPANFAGSSTFTYNITDDEAATATATVTITVTPVNDGPVAGDDVITVTEDAAATVVDVLANDADVEGAAAVTAVTQPANGTVTLVTGVVRYQPPANFAGTTTFAYTIADSEAATDTATVTVTVTPVNDRPVAGDDAITVAEDAAATIVDVLANDSDIDGAVTVTGITQPANGTVTLVTGVVRYQPPANFAGTTTFTYTIADSEAATDTATVAVSVTPVDDVPVASAGTTFLGEDSSATVLMSGTDADGDALTFAIVTGPAHGPLGVISPVSPALAGVTYTPTANYNGPDSFTFVVSDGAATSAPATSTITVNPVNDQPVAVDDGATVAEDSMLAIDATFLANDPDTEAPPQVLAVVGAQNPVNGGFQVIDGVRHFVPILNYNGPASFEYVVSDGGLTDIGLVSVTVTPVNDPPVAIPGATSTNEDTAVVIALLGADVDNNPLTFTILDGPATGVLGPIVQLSPTTAQVTYTPPAYGAADTSFTFRANDSAVSSTPATVAIDVVPVNDAPSATAGIATADPDLPIVLTLRGADVDGDALTFALVTGPTRGTLGPITQLTPTSASVRYTPNEASVTDDELTFRANDGALSSAPATFTIIVTGAECGDGLIEETETCDDQVNADGDGCSPTCQVEAGWLCTGEPSACVTVCGDNVIAGAEECDDNNVVNTDGCTNQCVVGPVCTAAAIVGGTRYATDPATGHCYVSFDSVNSSWTTAASACESSGGHLATITSASEQGLVASVQNPGQTPWIGASDAAAEGTFRWVNISFAHPAGEPVGFTNYQTAQPDHVGTAAHCLQLTSASSGFAGQWFDSSCTTGGAFGRICEVAPSRCGDGVVQTGLAEECDDGNTVSGDGCTATCTAEIYISEYLEGSVDSGLGTQNDALEFHNRSVSKVVMPGLCLIQIYRDAVSNFGQSSLPTDAKTILAGGTLSFCNNQGTAGLLARCPDGNTGPTVLNKTMFFSSLQHTSGGNDVFVLRCNVVSNQFDSSGFIYDVVGQLGTNPGTSGWGSGELTTSNHTLRRTCSSVVRKTDLFAPFDPTNGQWTSFPADTIDDVANRSCP